ncbi:redoxin domain-containing protein [Streptomyces sp. NPDC002773]|uniref:redoxin domain-containing protein n=1 Tax=Streptomyces sp. NPDC002773 TaxID=3154430 RepID=UPI00332CB1FF
MGDYVGDFALPGGSIEAGRFTRRTYMLCRQRGRVMLLFFSPALGRSDHLERLMAYADLLAERRQPPAWALWAISPDSLSSQEVTAHARGLTTPLLADDDDGVARMFGLAPADSGRAPAVFLIAPDRTLLWKCLSPAPEALDVPGPFVQDLAH